MELFCHFGYFAPGGDVISIQNLTANASNYLVDGLPIGIKVKDKDIEVAGLQLTTHEGQKDLQQVLSTLSIN